MPVFSGFLILVITIVDHAFASTDQLQNSLQKLASETDGRVGVCALNVATAERSCVNSDQRFSLQSVMKLIVAAAVMDAVDQKTMHLEDIVIVLPKDASPGPQEFADIVRIKGSLQTSLEDLIIRAVTNSDSTAVDKLIERLGGVTVVQEFLKRKQITGVRIDRNERHLQAESLGLTWRAEYADTKKFEAAVKALSVEKRDAAWTAYLNDQRDTATPTGMVDFLSALATGKLLSKNSTKILLSTMAKTATGQDRLMAGTPKGWSLGHKTGTSSSWKGMTAATNDVGILTAPNGRQLAIAVFVAESKRLPAARAAVIAKAAKLVANTYKGSP